MLIFSHYSMEVMPTMDELGIPAQQGDMPETVMSEPAQDPALSDEDTEAKAKASRAIVEGFVVYEKLLSDVEITPEPTNPVKRKHEHPATRLKAIGGYPAEIIKIDDLRMFCVRNQIKGARKASKLQLCHAIAQARVKHDHGEPLPYVDCFPRDMKDHSLSDVDVDLADGIDTKSKKRAREDFGEAANMELGGDTSIHLSITDRVEQSKLITLQSRIAQSVEVKNMAVYLKETIESASAIRREIREERSLRDVLWEKLVAQVGDEIEASSKYIAYRKAKQLDETEVESDDEGFVRRSGEQVLEDIYEEDILIRQLKKQHVKLTEAVSKLV